MPMQLYLYRRNDFTMLELLSPAGSMEALEAAVAGCPEDATACGMYDHETVIPAMEEARKVADALELKVAKRAWPFPTYADMLFYV